MQPTHFDLFIRATFDIDNVSGPDFVGVRITADWMAMQTRRNSACLDLELYKVEVKQAPLHVDSGGEVSIDSWRLRLDGESFQFVGKASGGGNTRSDPINITDAQALFDAVCGTGELPIASACTAAQRSAQRTTSST